MNDKPKAQFYLKVGEVAELWRVSEMAVYRLVRSGELESVRIGRTIRIPESALARYLGAVRQVSAVNVGIDHGIVQVELSDGRLIEVVFDEYGIPHAGRRLTTSTPEGYIIEMILPYDVRVLRKIGDYSQPDPG